MDYGAITTCQTCKSQNVAPALFLGYLPPVNTMQRIGAPLAEQPWFPAEMRYCRDCHLAQIGFAVDPRILFPPDYPYTSGSTRILRENFAALQREVAKRVPLSAEDLVVDIGSNDGTLLSNFQQAGQPVLGIEPTLTGEIARERGIPTIMSFLDRAAVAKVKESAGQPRVVTAANVFAHIHDVHEVMHCVEQLTGADGVFVSESHYLVDLIDTLQYDTIYHEHLRYYSLHSLKHLLESHGYRVFAAQRIPTHGGSIRVFASKSHAFPVEPSVEEVLAAERAAGIASEAWIGKFRARVADSRAKLLDLLANVRRDGGRVHGIGAPSRASTLITYCGLDETHLECVLEISTSKKVGKYMPGTNVPVLDEAKLFAEQPSHALLLSWHISDELCKNLKKKGFRGDFIIPLPEPRIIKNAEVAV